ncbi:2-oxoacid:ferredoxin oxidoreductase subunit beta [bacterium]|nr:2-oxoacid:ferredoxin oxidoreductase subunit beta [bacterium]
MSNATTIEETQAVQAQTVQAEECAANPLHDYLRMDRMPHIWCPGCGIGTSVSAFIQAFMETGIPKDEVSIVSGIGCTGRVAGYLNFDSFHTTHGRAIPFATGLKLANPKQQVVVYSGDGDLVAIGGNHLLHAARRNMDIKVICVNNFVYSMTGGQAAATTPKGTVATTAPFGFFETQLNLPHFMEACGANFVARWTTFHVRQLRKAMQTIFEKKGFCFIEVIAPCPTLYGRRNKYRTALDETNMFKDVSKIDHNADPRETEIKPGEEIICGNFVDRDRPDYLALMDAHFQETFGDHYKTYEGASI